MTDPKSDGGVDYQALDLAEGISVEPLTQWRLFRTRFVRHRLAMVSVFVLSVIVAATVLADFLPLANPLRGINDSTGRLANLLSPRSGFWFGTDDLGRDIFSRVVYGGRTSLTIAGLTGLMVASLGTLVGAVAGYYGGWIDSALMRFTDLILSLPLLPVAIVAAASLRQIFQGHEALALAILLGTLLWGSLARIVRAEFLSLREKEFVESARASGARDRRIIFRHILPNALSPIIVNTTLVIGGAIILEAALSFLGFGVAPPTPAWGQMAADGGRVAVTGSGAWWFVVFPSAALIITVLAVNFLGDGLRDALDPTQTIERK
ncbi:MAG TPA: ABC transporter permease [Acidimicrobiia bacterium]|nr:ABC transporter permease [Acidimicrobiia bacterium]